LFAHVAVRSARFAVNIRHRAARRVCADGSSDQATVRLSRRLVRRDMRGSNVSASSLVSRTRVVRRGWRQSNVLNVSRRCTSASSRTGNLRRVAVASQAAATRLKTHFSACCARNGGVPHAVVADMHRCDMVGISNGSHVRISSLHVDGVAARSVLAAKVPSRGVIITSWYRTGIAVHGQALRQATSDAAHKAASRADVSLWATSRFGMCGGDSLNMAH